MQTNAAPAQKSTAPALLVAFDAALLGLGILICLCGSEAGLLLALPGAFFLALATWNSWPLLARRATHALLALAWFSGAVWFCLSWGSRVKAPGGAMSFATRRGWPFRFGLRSHGFCFTPDPSRSEALALYGL